MKTFIQRLKGNPLDRILKKAQKKEQKSFLLFWNRGLGDIALGLFAIVHRIREKIPDAKITFLTRSNLHDGFQLLGDVDILIAKDLKRKQTIDIKELLQQIDVDPKFFDVIIENPDPTKWARWQLGQLTPLLHWKQEWEPLFEKYGLDPNETYFGAHVQTETNYASWRDWPLSAWRELFERVTARGSKILLFGFEKSPDFDIEGVVDLRGETPLFELLSIIKNCCKALIVPDSGVSSMTYFLNVSFPIKLVSLWANPYMGILKQNVPSPNPELKHIPIVGIDQNISNITPKQIEDILFT